jgi:outer membrane protein
MRIAILLVALLATAGLDAQTVLTLDQAVAFARDNHQQVQLARLNIEDAAAQITERRAIGIPQLSADIGYTRFLALPVTILPVEFGLDPNTGQPNPDFDREVRFGVKNNLTGTLALRSMLFDPSYFVGLQAARAYRDYTAQELVSVQRETRHQVIEAFLPVLLVNEQVINLDDNLTNLQRLRDETAALHAEGFAELLDVERLDLSIYTLRTERESVISQRENLLHYLKMAMGWPMDKALDVQGSLDELLTQAGREVVQGKADYQSWPEYRVAEQGLELARLNVRLNKFGYMPSLDAFANIQRMYMGDNFSDGVWANAALAGLGLKVPIFDGLLTHARIQRAEVTRKNSEVQIEMLRQQIDLSIQNARNHYQTMVERLRNQERNLALAEKIYQTTRTKYREGVGSSLEINQAEQALFTAQRQHTQARFDLIQAMFRLEKASGK